MSFTDGGFAAGFAAFPSGGAVGFLFYKRAGANAGGGYGYKSVDGVTWEEMSDTFLQGFTGTTPTITWCGAANGVWIAQWLCDTVDTGVNDILWRVSTDDGETWTTALATADLTLDSKVSAFGMGDGVVVVRGLDSITGQERVLRIDPDDTEIGNDIDWYNPLPASPAWVRNLRQSGCADFNSAGRWLFATVNDSTFSTDAHDIVFLYTDDQGASWASSTPIVRSSYTDLPWNVAWDEANGVWIAVGMPLQVAPRTLNAFVADAGDLNTWTQYPISNRAFAQEWAAVAANNAGRCIAFVDDIGSAPLIPDLFVSDDGGQTWTEITGHGLGAWTAISRSGTGGQWPGLTYVPALGKFATVGRPGTGGTNPNRVWLSTDASGESWVEVWKPADVGLPASTLFEWAVAR